MDKLPGTHTCMYVCNIYKGEEKYTQWLYTGYVFLLKLQFCYFLHVSKTLVKFLCIFHKDYPLSKIHLFVLRINNIPFHT